MIDTLALIYTPSIVDGYINLMSEIGAKINIDLKKVMSFVSLVNTKIFVFISNQPLSVLRVASLNTTMVLI